MAATVKPWACIARLGGIGDNIIVSSVLPHLHKDYHVEVIAQDPQGCVFENNPYIDKLTIKKQGDIPFTSAEEWQGWFEKRGAEYAYFRHLSHSIETELALFPGQTKFYWPAEWRRAHCGVNYLEYLHDICGVPYEFDPRFYPTNDERAKAVQTKSIIGDRMIGWCLSGSRIDKIYPYSAAAIAHLIRELGIPVVLFGSPTSTREMSMAEEIRKHVEHVNGSTTGLQFALPKWTVKDDGSIAVDDADVKSWPIRRSLALLQQCDMVIGPDTGSMWAVAMEDIPKVVLLSHASPENIVKYWHRVIALHTTTVPCYPCHRLHSDFTYCTPNKEKNAAACISSIPIEHIVRCAQAALTGQPVQARSEPMSMLTDIWHKLTGTTESAEGTAVAGQAATPADPSAPKPVIDVEAIVQNLATQKGGGGNWRTSIVDLLHVLGLDSSAAARHTLAQELNVTAGTDGSAERNEALYKALMQKLEENGGKVPDSLKG